MKKGKIIFIVYFLLIYFIISLNAQTSVSSYDQLMQDHVENIEGPGYTVIVTKGGEVIYQNAMGMSDIELGAELTVEHVFRIGSITKQFTAVAILLLEEEGKLSVTDDIKKFIPDYPIESGKVNIEHLLTHTSGIKSYTSMGPEFKKMMRVDMSPIEVIDVFKNEAVDFEPGEEFRYNNSGYILLGHIIEVVSGQSYEDFIETRLFEPLEMNQSYYGHATEIIPNRAKGYQSSDQSPYENAEYISMTIPYAAGSLLSTVGDIHKWYKAVMSGEVLSPESLKKAHTPFKLNNGEVTDYGYGWGIGDLKGSKTISHGGGINGFSTASTYLPEEDVFVSTFTNCDCQNPGKLNRKLAALAIGKPIENPKSISVNSEMGKAYVGFYELKPGLILKVRENDGKFFIKPTGQGETEVIPVAEHEFYVEAIDSKVKFNVSEGQQVKSLILYQGGEHLAEKLMIDDKMDLSSIRAYEGTYELAAGQHIIISIEDGHLVGEAFGDKQQLYSLGNGNFLDKVEPVKLSFSQEDDGTVSSVTLFLGGPNKAMKIK